MKRLYDHEIVDRLADPVWHNVVWRARERVDRLVQQSVLGYIDGMRQPIAALVAMRTLVDSHG